MRRAPRAHTRRCAEQRAQRRPRTGFESSSAEHLQNPTPQRLLINTAKPLERRFHPRRKRHLPTLPPASGVGIEIVVFGRPSIDAQPQVCSSPVGEPDCACVTDNRVYIRARSRCWRAPRGPRVECRAASRRFSEGPMRPSAHSFDCQSGRTALATRAATLKDAASIDAIRVPAITASKCIDLLAVIGAGPAGRPQHRLSIAVDESRNRRSK